MNQIALNSKNQPEQLPFSLQSAGMQGVIPKLVGANQTQITNVFQKNDEISKNRLRSMYD